MSKTTAGGFRFNDDDWPILRVIAPAQQSDDDFSAYLKQLATYRRRNEPYAIIYDIRPGRGLSAKQRRMQSDYIKESISLRITLKAFAAITRSGVQRGALTAIFWLSGSPWPRKVFTSESEAEQWVKSFFPN